MSPMADSPRFNPYRKPHSAASARSIQVPRSTLPPRLKRSLIPRTPFENDKDQEPARSSIDYSQVPTSPGSFPDPELPPPPLLVEWNAKAPQTSTQSLVALQEIVQVGPQGVVRRRRLVPIPPDTTNTNAPARSHVSGTSSTRIRLKGNGHARQVRIIQPPPQESMGLGDSSINPIEIDGMDKSTTPVVLSARRVWQSNKSPRVFIGKIQEQRGGVQLQPVLLWSLARPRSDPHMTQDISEKLLQNSPLRAGEQQFQFDFQIMKQPELRGQCEWTQDLLANIHPNVTITPNLIAQLVVEQLHKYVQANFTEEERVKCSEWLVSWVTRWSDGIWRLGYDNASFEHDVNGDAVML